MKNLLIVSALVVMFSSCAYVATPVTGWIYTDVQGPITATSNTVATKVGTSDATSILGWIASGDASINTAAQKAGIKRISHVDYHSTSILGIFAKFTVYVYGE
jgi:hypothetical protein